MFRDSSIGTKLLALSVLFAASLVLTAAAGLRGLPGELIAGLATGGLLTGLLASWAMARDVAVPLGRLAAALERLAAGDTSADPALGERHDTIGAMQASFLVLTENIANLERLRVQQRDLEARAEEERRRHTAALARRLEESVRAGVEELGGKASEIIEIAGGVATEGEGESGDVIAVAEASRGAAETLAAIAASVEELSASIGAISGDVGRATHITGQAADEVRRTANLIATLGEASAKVEGAVEIISRLAAQTNMLALNATIEASRAGDAGKGFTVVAAEVKALAHQTSQAARDIAQVIAGMRNATHDAVSTVDGIVGTIESVDAIASSISASISQQRSATQDIARSLNQVSLHAGTVSDGVADVTLASAGAYASAIRVMWAADEIKAPANQLAGNVGRFISSIK
jgi:methyl-accepting chemotaxis protein